MAKEKQTNSPTPIRARSGVIRLKSASAYSQSKNHEDPKRVGETEHDYQERTFRSHLHLNDKGLIYIPGTALKLSLQSIASHLAEKIAGKGSKTFTKSFTVGLLITSHIELGIKPEDAFADWIYADAQPSKGKNKGRVWRCYPTVREWKGDAEFTLVDEMIPNEIFEDYVTKAGIMIGMGRWRREVGGMYGAFSAKVEWK